VKNAEKNEGGASTYAQTSLSEKSGKKNYGGACTEVEWLFEVDLYTIRV
jgi:hypothetical protein